MQPGEVDTKNPKWHQMFEINTFPVERLWLLWDPSFRDHIVTVNFYADLSTVENDNFFSLDIILKDCNYSLELAHHNQKGGR